MSLPDESPQAVEARAASYLLGTYAYTKFHPRDGRGARLVDADGKVYWDLLAGIAVNALGYRHPRLVKALRAEATDLLHVSNLFYQAAQGELAERLVTLSGLTRAFFCNSGTEANEAAIKFARLANPGRSKLVALDNSFHGRTVGAVALTGNAAYREPFEPLLPGVTFVPRTTSRPSAPPSTGRPRRSSSSRSRARGESSRSRPSTSARPASSATRRAPSSSSTRSSAASAGPGTSSPSRRRASSPTS